MVPSSGKLRYEILSMYYLFYVGSNYKLHVCTHKIGVKNFPIKKLSNTRSIDK